VHSELFGSLAKEDDGNDPATFETTLLSNRLQNAEALSKLAERLETMESRLSACALNGVALMKPTTLKAYEIAKAVAGRVSRSELIFPAQDFYRATAMSGAKSRAKKKEAATTTAPPVADKSTT